MKFHFKIVEAVFFILSGCALSSCSLFSPVHTTPSSTYLLTDMPAPWQSARKHKRTLLVVPPEVDAAYRTSEMAYSLQPYQIAYYSKNRWAATPSQMLHPLIIQTLQNTHYFHAVVSPSYIGRYDYLLKTQLMELQQDFTQCPAVYRIVLRAQMSSAATARVLAVKQFNVEVPVANNTPYSGVRAANRATVKLLRQLAEFSLKSVK